MKVHAMTVICSVALGPLFCRRKDVHEVDSELLEPLLPDCSSIGLSNSPQARGPRYVRSRLDRI